MRDADAGLGASGPLAADELRQLQQRSDARGLARLLLHLLAIGLSGSLYGFLLETQRPLPLQALACLALGFTLVTMFACMHESVHRTAFKSRWLNDSAAWLAGLLSFYNSTFYRYYHGWHHRFTQLPGQDPELEDPKPTSIASYLVEMSGVGWWLGKLRTHLRLAAGRTASYGYLNEQNRASVVRSVRLQLLVYGLGVAASLALARPLILTYWLLPVALGQPLLRAILLAEHGGCSLDDNPLTNTRTTHTLLPVRLLMWEMPYHAEHHRYPALPFFVLARTHRRLGPELTHVARHGYLGMHLEYLKTLRRRRAAPAKEQP